MSSEERLRDSLIAAGFEPTPEGLARAAKMSVRDARLVFLLCRRVPAEVLAVLKACTALRVRVAYMLGEDVPPMVHGSLTPFDREALNLLSDLNASGARRWLRFGGRLRDNS